MGHADGANGRKKRWTGLAFCVGCIFLGSAAENTMSNWISGFMENALHIPKAWGDIFGMALFGTLLGLGRILYAKYGRNISNVLLAGMAGATVCYLVAGLSKNVVFAFAACVLTGFCTSMLWPGTLILMEEKVENPGVTAYALMAAGGDLGASLAPQLMGVVVDTVSVSAFADNMGAKLSMTAEQVGLKTGMLTASVYPILGIVLLLFVKRYFKKQNGKV